jgi:hypothetical protein
MLNKDRLNRWPHCWCNKSSQANAIKILSISNSTIKRIASGAIGIITEELAASDVILGYTNLPTIIAFKARDVLIVSTVL